MSKNFSLGNLLISANKISESQLGEALCQQKKERKKCIEEILVELGFVNEEDILEVLENQLKIPSIDLANYTINPKVISIIPENIARRYGLIPIDKKNNKLIIAVSDPFNIIAIDDIKLLTGMEIEVVVSLKSVILKTIDKFYRVEKTKKVLEELEESYIPSSIKDLEDGDLSDVNSAPVVKLVNSIVVQAIKVKASDIHIEPFENSVRVRYRIDGDLQEIMKFSIKSHMAIVTRVKIMGKMDIAERRIPQDGRVETELEGKEIDMRISTLPTVHGEKIAIRLLDRNGFSFLKEDLGFEDRDLKIFNKIIKQPYGIVLVTGPTGSGKSTTLYTILKDLNDEEKNIVTIEDPVEYKLEGINQVQINNKSGLTFANGLRSILRQDPDIIMIGEIRDSETAKIAIRASITGHLVLSTLHTNDTASTIVRLIDMGIEPYLLSTSVIGIISQRLVKKLCSNCKTPYEPSLHEKKMLGLNLEDKATLHKPVGCNKCFKGYRGRIAIHEIMDIDKDIRKLIDNRATTDELKEASIKNGMITLYDNVVNLALKGITSVEEVFRIGYTLD
ncbi:General secretion pathway protein E Type II traffic warden ATPase [Proteiniborus sp. DW1]|uniref:GspE/PulE family protein n=1 Tax=Proteiniborus sp. DW1 TaxID=1889883 RepID=UPI00092DFBCC|nr:GspE/PulE family protein [Proteiniborus sp. DW1]SCG83287.1 General secretion pathway protein E Type II traffic warden ATPase [Proteiniborus sp. DW1]